VHDKAKAARRQATLTRLKLLERDGDPSLTALTRLASFIAGTSAAAIHVIDDTYQHRVAAVGAPLGRHPREDAMCHLVVDDEHHIVCEDATRDARFSSSPFVGGDEPVRCYVSVPLRMADDTVIGTLCAWDAEARSVGDEQLARLQDLAEQIASIMQFTRIVADLGDAAIHDPLTGAVNRLLLDDRLASAFARQIRRGGRVLVAVLDIDGFKQINDAYGHDGGDRVLIAIAQRLRVAMRNEDTVARIGGDEFAVIAEITPDGIEPARLIDRMERALAPPIAFGGAERRVRVSVGAAFAEPGDDVRTAIGRAGEIMVARKRGARDDR
jgi:diguanylate cyclase (GGDEF)-like protein